MSRLPNTVTVPDVAVNCHRRFSTNILASYTPTPSSDQLIVGNLSRDDAAVYHIGDGQCIISTTDFFMPIVDDPFDFGRIAATNAISDIYAMGGKPINGTSHPRLAYRQARTRNSR